MKKIALITGLLCVSGSALAADAGLGVSVHSNDATIYIPIDVSKSFRIEPMLRYLNNESEDRVIPNSPYTATYNQSVTSLTLGVGLFGVKQLADSVSVYYGGRVGYQSTKFESSVSGSLPPGYIIAPSTDKFDGFLLAPTMGLEYHFSEHFSIGGEVALEYTSVDGDDSSEESTSTATNIIFRYMF